MLPSIRRKEWRELVTGTINPKISSHSLRIKLNSIRRKVASGLLSPDNAALELFVECKTHLSLYRNDLHHIFKKEQTQHV